MGTLSYEKAATPICPVCGCECDIIYIQNGCAIGCNECIDQWDAWDWQEEREIEKRDLYDEDA